MKPRNPDMGWNMAKIVNTTGKWIWQYLEYITIHYTDDHLLTTALNKWWRMYMQRKAYYDWWHIFHKICLTLTTNL